MRSTSHPAPSSSISAPTAIRAPTVPMSSCRARPIPRNRGSTSIPRGACRWPGRASFPPGDRARGWAILRALSDVLGHKLPYDSLAQLRQALFAAYPHLQRIDQIAPGDRADVSALAALGGTPEKRAAFGSVIDDFYLTNPIARSSRRHGGMLGDRRGPYRSHRGRIAGCRTWRNFDQPTFGRCSSSSRRACCCCCCCSSSPPMCSMPIARSGRRCRSGAAQRGRALGPAAILRRSAQFVVKEPIIPAGANKGVFLLAPVVTAVLALSAWAVIPVSVEWEIADLNVGILYIFAISSLMVYGVIMAGWSSNSKYPLLAACARRRRWCPTRSPSASSSSPCCSALARSISPPSWTRRRASTACSTGSGCRCSRCSWSSSSRRSPRPIARHSTWWSESELVAG